MRAGAIIAGTAAHPIRTSKALAAEPHGWASGLRVLLISGGLCVLLSAALAAAGALAFWPPFLRIVPENYYALQAAFILPVLLLAWLAAGGLGFLLTRRRGQGSYESLLAALAPALAVPLLVVEFFAAALALFLALGGTQEEIMDLTAAPGVEQAVALGYPLLAAAWMLLLSVVAVRVVRRSGRLRSAGAGLAAGCVLIAALAVFLR